MKKNYSLAIIVGLLCLIVGFLFGKSANNIGRYTYKDYDNGRITFDTSTGLYYFKGDYGIIRRDVVTAYKEQMEKRAKARK